MIEPPHLKPWKYLFVLRALDKGNINYSVYISNSAEESFLDGIFKCWRKLFYQLYTEHELRNGHFHPLVYFLQWTCLSTSLMAQNTKSGVKSGIHRQQQ